MKNLNSIQEEEAINSAKKLENNVNSFDFEKFNKNLTLEFSKSSSISSNLQTKSSVKLIKKVLAKCDQSFT